MNTVIVNGRTISVTPETYKQILAEEDNLKYYNSASKGRIKISEMANEHLRNAILKMAKEEIIQSLDSLKTASLISATQSIRRGLVTPSTSLEALIKEAENRAVDKTFDRLFGNPFKPLHKYNW